MRDGSLENAFSVIARNIVPKGSLRRQWQLTGGVSAQVHALEISCQTGKVKHVVVRRHGFATWKPLPDDVTITEYQLLSTLYRAGLPVPEPLILDTSKSILPSPYFVMAMVDGTTTIDKHNMHNALLQMAEFLSRLHRLSIESLDVPKVQRCEDPIQGALSYLPDDDRFGSIRAVVRNHTLRSTDTSLLHGDYWPGNILWNDSELAAVIDWEDAAIGSSICDLAVCRTELNVRYGVQVAQRFTEHYLAARPVDISDLPIWEIYVGSAALATMHEWRLPPATEKARRRRTLAFVTRAASELDSNT